MPNPLAIDCHAHICTEETMNLLNKAAPKVGSALKEIEKDVYEWTVAGTPYRPLPRGGFDIEQRLKDMKTSEVDMQVLSNTPQTFLYNHDAGMTTTTSQIQDDQIAKLVKDHPRSFYGIATLPMQAPKAAADELERSISKLGLKGMQIGSNINGKNLDEPEFEPVWQVANAHNAFCMVHPNNVAGADRLVEGPQYTRPRDFRGLRVPDVLLSGDHGRIAMWRHEQAVAATQRRSPTNHSSSHSSSHLS